MAEVNPGRAPVRTPRATKYAISADDFQPLNANGRRTLLKDTTYILENAIDLDDTVLEVPDSSVTVFAGSTTELQEIDSMGGFYADGFRSLVLHDMIMVGRQGDTFLDLTGRVGTGPGPPLRGLVRLYSYNEIRQFTDLGSINTTDRVLMANCFVGGTRGPLTVDTFLLCDIRENRFDYIIGGPTQPASFTWVRLLTEAIEIFITDNVFSLSDDVTNPRYGLYIDPIVAPNAAVPATQTSVIVEGNEAIGGTIFFEPGDEDEITAFTDNLDGTITISTADTGSLANGEDINILRTENYNGGYVVSNVVANTSFDITATYVDNPGRGTWHSGSLDHRDERVISRGNSGIPNSRNIFFGFSNGNTTATDITVLDTWEDIEVTGFQDSAGATERFALTGDGTSGQFIYYGHEGFKGQVSTSMTVFTSNAADKDYEFAISVNDADPTADVPVTTVTVNNDLVTATILCAMPLERGDTVQIKVRQVSGTVFDITIQDITILGTDSD